MKDKAKDIPDLDKTEVDGFVSTLMKIPAIKAHVEHARTKHPDFVDLLDDEGIDGRTIHLKNNRDYLKWQKQNKCLDAYAIMECELDEFMDAIHRGKSKEAAHELLDLVAIGLRLLLNDKQLVTWRN